MDYQKILDGELEFVLNPSVVFKTLEGDLLCYVPETGEYYKFTEQEREIIQIYLDCKGENRVFLLSMRDRKDLLGKTEEFLQELEKAKIMIMVKK